MSNIQIEKEIKKKLNDLTDNEKMGIVNYLLEELDKPDPEIDKAWAKEAVRRQKEMRWGKRRFSRMPKFSINTKNEFALSP